MPIAGSRSQPAFPISSIWPIPIFSRQAERLRRDIAFGRAMESADLIFTLSEFSQKDLARAYGCDERRIKVVYPSAAPRFLAGRASADAIDRVKEKFALPPAYAIFPSNFWPHKNHKVLFDALRRLRRSGTAIPLVLVGDASMAGQALKGEIDRAKQERWLWVLGYVADEELHALVSGAKCLLFPSLFEGFGIPLAEALAVGVAHGLQRCLQPARSGRECRSLF